MITGGSLRNGSRCFFTGIGVEGVGRIAFLLTRSLDLVAAYKARCNWRRRTVGLQLREGGPGRAGAT